ncbi:Uncharacterised protein [Achromobacter xylosoxidans]|nr:hypothetical protein LMG1866_04637 [Achromobacter ruhlandii]CAB3920343.1 hypothetical protein LMG26846_05550 [Achromobacter insuavis]CUJ32441.1 Uncharacterised protein [Achromobacter xylosoxidans]CUJ40666.1 Uncharacterised protein [Achromobacter sp. 2789STDY5608621]
MFWLFTGHVGLKPIEFIFIVNKFDHGAGSLLRRYARLVDLRRDRSCAIDAGTQRVFNTGQHGAGFVDIISPEPFLQQLQRLVADVAQR